MTKGFSSKQINNFDSIDSINLNYETVDLFDFNCSGIYQITCLKNKKIYIGQTSSILERAGGHAKALRLKTHESRDLQEDWDKYGSKKFTFQIVEIIKNASNLELKEREKSYLHDLLDNNISVYNTDLMNYKYTKNFNVLESFNNKKNQKTFLESIIYKGKTFNTYSDVIYAINQERTSKGQKTISRTRGSFLIKNQQIEGVEQINLVSKQVKRIPYMDRPITIDGIKYNSAVEIVQKGLSSNIIQVFSNIINPLLDWHFFKRWHHFNPVVIDNQVYPNIRTAVELIRPKVSHKTIARYLDNNRYPNYYRIDNQNTINYWYKRFQELVEETNNNSNKDVYSSNSSFKYKYKINYKKITYTSFLNFAEIYNCEEIVEGKNPTNTKLLQQLLEDNKIADAYIISKIPTNIDFPLTSLKVNK